MAAGLSFGFLPSEAAKIFDEFDFLFSRKIAKGSIFEKKRNQNCKKIADSEWIKPKTEVNRSPPQKHRLKNIFQKIFNLCRFFFL